MPAEFRIDRGRRRVFTTGNGVLSWDDAVGHMERLSKDPDFDPAFSQLADFRKVTAFELTHDQIYDLANRRVFADGAKRAFVTETPTQFGLARMFQTYLSSKGAQGIRIFSNIEEAIRWLDLVDPAGKPEQGQRPPA
jgi:hypothetical protein